MKTQQFGLDTWGNNIANIDTTGFRYSNPEFSSMMSAASGGSTAAAGQGDVGLGVTSQATALNFSQGVIQNTDREFDLALQGKGFFGVLDQQGTMNYTRNGSLYVNSQGYLIDQSGNFILGQKAPNLTINQKDLSATVTAANTQPTMGTPGKQDKIQIPLTVQHPGLPGTPEVRQTDTVGQFSYVSGSSTNYSYYVPVDTVPTIHVFNMTGTELGVINLDPTKKGNHNEKWTGNVDTPVLDANGKPVLDAKGNPTTQSTTLTSGDYIFKVEFVSKIAVPAIPPGSFAQYQVDTNGKLIAQFDNGQESTIAQIPVYQFQNEQGLTKVGDNLFQASSNSGSAFFDKDSTGTYMPGADILASAIETSNVSLATAMTQLLITQKAYDANAKCITTSDQMIQKALAMKSR